MSSAPRADELACEHERVPQIPRTIQRITERTRPGFDTPRVCGLACPAAGPRTCPHRPGLHQLRHSALTRAAENGTHQPAPVARSRHACARSLARHARPGPEAAARVVAEADPTRRRTR